MRYGHRKNHITVNAVMNMSESVLIKCGIDYYSRLSNCFVTPTTTTEISWSVCMHVCVRLLGYKNTTVPFFWEESFDLTLVT